MHPIFHTAAITATALASSACAHRPTRILRATEVRSPVYETKRDVNVFRKPHIETRIWRQGDPDLKLIPKDEGFCALSMVTGCFAGGGELVRVWVAEDNYWHLSGRSNQEGVAAECIIIHYR